MEGGGPRRSPNSQPAPAARGDVGLTPGHMPTIDADEAAGWRSNGVLLDARPRAAYVGDPAKAGTGHIPGAILAPSGGNIADGQFKPSEELRAGFAEIGADGSGRIGVYCGSGNAAAHAIAAMRRRAGRCTLRGLVVGVERRSGAPGRDGKRAEVAQRACTPHVLSPLLPVRASTSRPEQPLRRTRLCGAPTPLN